MRRSTGVGLVEGGATQEIAELLGGQVAVARVVVGEVGQGGMQRVHAATRSWRSTRCPLRKVAGAYEGDEVGCVDCAPALLGGLDE